MSQSPYVYNDKQTRQAYGDQSGAPITGYSNAQNVYAYPQQAQQQQQQQQQRQQQPNQQQPNQQPNPQHQQPAQQSPVQQQTRAFPYAASNTGYPQYDQSQGAVYATYSQPVQQYQNVYQQPNAQIPPQQAYGNIPGSSSSSISTNTTGVTGTSNATSAIPYPQQPTYLASNPYQVNPAGYPAPNPGAYGYAYPSGLPVDQSHVTGLTSGSNINMANIRGPLQSATNPPLIDPNQVPQRPKLTTTFWEDEGTVCYQVESRGISVSRREDTNFINGTKLLNVAGMTRGRRDGILKSEKVRYVVKIGAMNLKGVWIPFERALELARNEGIVDLLYPLFVKDIKELYQGPQFSGGLTAAANQNPKNIIPVQVTNTTYIPHVYASREKKKPQTTSTDASQDQLLTPGTQDPSKTPSTQQPPQQYSYPYSYGATQDASQYGAQSHDSNSSLSHYKTGSYYGYQAPQAAAGQTNSSTKLPTDGSDKAPEDPSEKR